MPTKQHGIPNLALPSQGIIRLANARIGGGGASGGGGGASGSGNITLGKNGGSTQTGYFENNAVPPVPLFGSIDNSFPVPPENSRIRAIVQESDLEWQIRLTGAGVPFVQSAWTSLTLSGLNGGIVLLSASASSFTANSFGASLWEFAATADIWDGLSAGSMQTYEFA